MLRRLYLALKRALFQEEPSEGDRSGWTPPRPMPPSPAPQGWKPAPPPSRLAPSTTVTDLSMGVGLGFGGGLLAQQLLHEEVRRREASPSPAPAPVTPVIIDDTGTYSDPVIAPFGAPEPQCTIVEAETHRPVEFSCPAPEPAPAPSYSYESPAPEPAPSPSYDSGSSSSSGDW